MDILEFPQKPKLEVISNDAPDQEKKDHDAFVKLLMSGKIPPQLVHSIQQIDTLIGLLNTLQKKPLPKAMAEGQKEAIIYVTAMYAVYSEIAQNFKLLMANFAVKQALADFEIPTEGAPK